VVPLFTRKLPPERLVSWKSEQSFQPQYWQVSERRGSGNANSECLLTGSEPCCLLRLGSQVLSSCRGRLYLYSACSLDVKSMTGGMAQVAECPLSKQEVPS
jgi:hypothetical protein